MVRLLKTRLSKGLALVLMFASLLLVVGLWPKPSLDADDSYGSVIVDRNGQLLRLTTNRDENYRFHVPLDRISEHVIKSTLMYEDRYFYYHVGVNPVALVEATLDSYVLGNRRRGASTITMQLARMRYGLKTTTPLGKLVQIFHAFRFEAHYSKQEILEAYLNRAPYGGNVVGIRAASLVYFDKEPAELTLAEAMTLSVIPQNPERRKPSKGGQEPEVLREARQRLARAWLEAYPEQNVEEMILTHSLEMRTPADLPFEAPHMTTEQLLESRERTLHLTLDAGLQRMVDGRIKDYVGRHRDIGITNAAALLVEADSMAVLASVGSADFFDVSIKGQVNAAAAKRSPGSTLKPFVYALALDQGLIHPGSLLKDAPFSLAEYAPHNFDGEFSGPITATEALVRSRNIPAVYLAASLEKEGLYGFLKQAGITGLRSKEAYGIAPVLGGIEISMESLTALYAMLKNGGVMRPLIKRLDMTSNSPFEKGDREFRNGFSDRPESKRLLSEEASFLTLKMLEENPRPGQGFEEKWIRDRVVAAWKTGTSPGSRDAWSVGVVGPFVLAVWVGQFSGGRPIYVGRKSAAPLFFDIVDSLRTVAPLDAASPNETVGVTHVSVCAISGALPSPHCPHLKKSWYIPGVSPIKQCEIHRPVLIDDRTGRRSCVPKSTHTRTEVYEFWPTDLLNLFEKAGLKRRAPPPFNKGCPDIYSPQYTEQLTITSPKERVDYAVRANRIADEKIAFRAVSDADARELYWFVDTRHIGTSAPKETLFWSPIPGTFRVRVVDDKGRSDGRELRVTVVE